MLLARLAREYEQLLIRPIRPRNCFGERVLHCGIVIDVRGLCAVSSAA